MLHELHSAWIAKLVGAISGSAISLAYLLPRNRREAAIRLFVGVSTGFMFGPWAAARMSALGFHGTEVENHLAGAALVSGVAWWGWGAVQRVLETQQFLKRDDDK